MATDGGEQRTETPRPGPRYDVLDVRPAHHRDHVAAERGRHFHHKSHHDERDGPRYPNMIGVSRSRPRSRTRCGTPLAGATWPAWATRRQWRMGRTWMEWNGMDGRQMEWKWKWNGMEWSGSTHDRHFTGDTLFDRIQRVVCSGELPRALPSGILGSRAGRRRFPRRPHSSTCGGLVAYVMLCPSTTLAEALCVDRRSRARGHTRSGLLHRLAAPRGRESSRERASRTSPLATDRRGGRLYACGAPTDVILRSPSRRARVAVLPRCHDEDT